MEEKKNKQARTWVSSKRKKWKVFDTFLAFCASVGYRERVSERNSNTATRNADLSSRVGWPCFWVHRSHLFAEQLPFFNRHSSPTSVDCLLPLTAPRPCLPSSSSVLVGNLANKLFVWVSRQNRLRNPLIGTHPHLRSLNVTSELFRIGLLQKLF